MKLKTKDIAIDSPFALVNELNFPSIEPIYPFQLRVITDVINFPIQAYKGNYLVEEGFIGIPSHIIKSNGLEVGMAVEVEWRRSFDSSAHRLIIDKVKDTHKIFNKEEIDRITQGFMDADIAPHHSTAFVLSQQFTEYSLDEIEAMARSFAESGRIFDFPGPTFAKHSLGGVPGNKITLLIVPILAAAGLLIPKTSTHAITSASGTADSMGVLAPVEISANEVIEIVNEIKACIVTGTKMGIAPVVDKIIKEAAFPLGLDPVSLMFAGILAKKIAMGVDFLVLDVPVGTEKVATEEEARNLARQFVDLAERLGIKAEAGLTYATVPVGHSIGPLLEAREALLALEGKGPTSLVEKSCELAGIVFELAGITPRGFGKQYSKDFLENGKALTKMREIIEAQGGDPKVTPESLTQQLEDRPFLVFKAPVDGWPHTWSNYALKEIARAAGAPLDPCAGIEILAKKESVRKGEEVFRVYASSESALDEVRGLIVKLRPVIVESVLLDRVA